MLKNAIARAKSLAPVLVGSAALVSGAASAQATDYSSILGGLDTTTAVAAVVGAGVLLAGIGFAKWATKKVATFFG